MQTSPCATQRSRRWRLLVRLALLALLAWAGWHIIHIAFAGNHHTVIPGRLYRGAQPSGASMEALVKKYGIRTVINVRGCCFPDNWFVQEAEVCQRLGVSLEDVSFSAIHLPSRDELQQLVAVLDHTEYPAFIHCRQGADRTGVAAMVALLLREDHSYASARRQLGLRYGHLSFGKTGVLDRFIDLYEKWLSQGNQEHTPARFRHWLLQEYRGGWCNAHFEEVTRLFAVPETSQPLAYRVRVRNTSSSAWHFHPQKTAGHHVVFKVINDTGEVVHEGRAGMFVRKVEPGETIQVTLIVPPIRERGLYRLQVDMIEEGHCWFHQSGSELWEEELAIRE